MCSELSESGVSAHQACPVTCNTALKSCQAAAAATATALQEQVANTEAIGTINAEACWAMLALAETSANCEAIQSCCTTTVGCSAVVAAARLNAPASFTEDDASRWQTLLSQQQASCALTTPADSDSFAVAESLIQTEAPSEGNSAVLGYVAGVGSVGLIGLVVLAVRVQNRHSSLKDQI
jgi:hypothetical protein